MAFTDAARWFLSMLHDATTWQSASLMKLPVLLGACMPQPTTPMVMRSEGAGRPSAPSALAGMMVGAAMAAAAVAIKRRREILGSMGFMGKYYAQPAIRVRVKILSGLNLNCPVRFTARRRSFQEPTYEKTTASSNRSQQRKRRRKSKSLFSPFPPVQFRNSAAKPHSTLPPVVARGKAGFPAEELRAMAG